MNTNFLNKNIQSPFESLVANLSLLFFHDKPMTYEEYMELGKAICSDYVTVYLDPIAKELGISKCNFNYDTAKCDKPNTRAEYNDNNQNATVYLANILNIPDEEGVIRYIALEIPSVAHEFAHHIQHEYNRYHKLLKESICSTKPMLKHSYEDIKYYSEVLMNIDNLQSEMNYNKFRLICDTAEYYQYSNEREQLATRLLQNHYNEISACLPENAPYATRLAACVSSLYWANPAERNARDFELFMLDDFAQDMGQAKVPNELKANVNILADIRKDEQERDNALFDIANILYDNSLPAIN